MSTQSASPMFPELEHSIQRLKSVADPTKGRRAALGQLITYVVSKLGAGLPVRLNFICTHNSRRSHLAQVWAQTLAEYDGLAGVQCYSAGTEATAVFPMITKTLGRAGFKCTAISGEPNPVYAIKAGPDALPLIAFSKMIDHPFNPASDFCAVMTCAQADGDCPVVLGAEKRIALPFEDPKRSDDTPQQERVYRERSWQIAAEMHYVFSRVALQV